MENYADMTDEWGAWIRVDVVQDRVIITIQDETTAAVSLNIKQAATLINALTDAIGGPY
jgi:hypothetical protein